MKAILLTVMLAGPLEEPRPVMCEPVFAATLITTGWAGSVLAAPMIMGPHRKAGVVLAFHAIPALVLGIRSLAQQANLDGECP